MKVAVIDLGTNTFHMLMVEIVDEEPGFRPILKKRIYVSLGEGGLTASYITPAASERAVNAMLQFREILDQYQVKHVYAVGTSALRNATNAPGLIQQIQERTNVKVEIISGEKEASLIYAGVKAAVSMADELVLVMDIGGGSVEFILSHKGKALWQRSFEIGAQRLVDCFHQQDPITPESLTQMDTYLEEILNPLFEVIRAYQPTRLIGSSGAFAILALVYAEKEKITVDPQAKALPFPVQKLEEIYYDIRYKTYQELLQVPGMPHQRIDMIVVSTSLIFFVLNRAGIEQLIVSKYALKEGLLIDIIKNLRLTLGLSL